MLYTQAKWWIEGVTNSATPMLCLFKKDKLLLQTVIDLRKHKNNTVKDIVPFPDQDEICESGARGKYPSKPDMTNAYKQVCIFPEHVKKMVFNTIYSTIYSNVLHQGECNTPNMFQCLMMHQCQHWIGWSIFIYLDNIFVYSNTVEEHERLLQAVVDILTKAQLHLSEKKVDLYVDWMDCLGHVVDHEGIHANMDKMLVISG